METKEMQGSNRPGEQRRKPYVTPACQSEPIFEVTALACGKVPGQSALCNGVPSAS